VAATRVKLAATYFWYFAAIGLFVPFWPLYLKDRGYSAVDIGLITALYAAMRVVGPPAYAHSADATGRRLAACRRGALAALACIVALPFLGTLGTLALAVAALSTVWNGLMAVYDAYVLSRLDADAGRYGVLRVWGSLGFIMTSAGGGAFLAFTGSAALPWMMAATVALTAWTLYRLDAGDERRLETRPTSLAWAFRDRRVLSFLLVSFLLLASLSSYYNFFSLFLERHGYSRGVIGFLWSWGVIAEIAVFLLAPWLVARFSLHTLMLVALGATALRWTALASLPQFFAVVFITQTLHMASFGLFHLTSVALVQALFPPEAAARGQALQGSIGYGAGGIVGSLGSGWLWDHVGPAAPYYAGAIGVTCGLAVAAIGLGGVRSRAPRTSNLPGE
jgi:PPP family 3-phenylpropionic acid transporter